MTDSQMIALFWERNEDAIRETDAVYGRRLYLLADQILHSAQDAEEQLDLIRSIVDHQAQWPDIISDSLII